MIKKTISVFLVLLLVLPMFSVGFSARESITSAETPVSAESTELLWSKKFGSTYRDAPSTVTVVGDTLLVMSKKKLYKLSTKTGETLGEADMVSSPNYGYTPPLYADSKIFVPLNNGTIQAFDYKSLKSLWIYSDELSGQSLTPITYSDGYIYTGFWNDEDKYANYVAVSTKDEDKKKTDEQKTASWTYKSLGGFYWAEAAIKGNFILFGTDNASAQQNGKSKLMVLDKLTGKTVDAFETSGDIRSGITYDKDSNRYFFTSKAGYLYSVSVSEKGKIDDASAKKLSLSGASTSTPAVFNGRIYVGVQDKGFSSGFIKVIDSEKMSVIYSVRMKGYPQNSVLISSSYYQKTGKIYIYSTYNSSPGGITLLVDSDGQTSGEAVEIYVPETDKMESCISTIVADSDGTLYYKNDSGNIFALKNTEKKKSFFETLWYYITLPFVWLKNLIFGK